MKKIDKNELYGHVREFLKGKGVELQDGTYSRRIQQGCHILAKTINTSRDALQRAKSEAGKRIDKVRQAIHEQTAPRPQAGSPPSPSEPATPKAKAASARPKAASSAKATATKSKPRVVRPAKLRRE